MAKYVFVSDTTLSREYSNFPLLDFLPCAPSGAVPRVIYEFLKGKAPATENGRAAVSPYALRKLEAALLRKHAPDDVVIAHEDYMERFIKQDTEVIGVYTMDPLGMAPLTMSYAILFEDASKAWVRVEFEKLIGRINRARRGTRAKLAVGGAGVWELAVMPELMEQLGIDFAFQGEADDIINEVLEDIANGSVYDSDYFQGFQSFDKDFHKVWVAHLLSQTPSFDVVFTNEPLTFRLLKEAGLRVERIPMFNRKRFTSTEVRRRLLTNGPWRELLPKSVASYLKKIGGDEILALADSIATGEVNTLSASDAIIALDAYAKTAA